MEDEADLLDLDQLEEPVSSDGDGEGSETEASEVEPEPAAVSTGTICDPSVRRHEQRPRQEDIKRM